MLFFILTNFRSKKLIPKVSLLDPLNMKKQNYAISWGCSHEHDAWRKLKKARLRMTPLRSAVIIALESAPATYLDVSAIQRRTESIGQVVSLANIYRILAEFESAKIAQCLRFNGKTLYRTLSEESLNSPQYICTHCGFSKPLIDNSTILSLKEAAVTLGFSEFHSAILTCICQKCAENMAP